jgi:hypothetical protein
MTIVYLIDTFHFLYLTVSKKIIMEQIKEQAVNSILKYKPMKFFISALAFLLVVSGVYHFYRCSKGLNSRFLWGAGECLECNVEKVDSITKHDTIVIYKSDTNKSSKSAKLDNKQSQKADVISNDQKGGQTAKEIHNNNP